MGAVKGAVAPALAVAGRAGRALQDALHAGPEAAGVLDEEEGDLVALAVDRVMVLADFVVDEAAAGVVVKGPVDAPSATARAVHQHLVLVLGVAEGEEVAVGAAAAGAFIQYIIYYSNISFVRKRTLVVSCLVF